MKILVTGANGQLGMSLRKLLPEAVFTDVEELDITDLAAVRALVAEHRIDTLINCAAYTNVDAAEDNEALAQKLNAQAVENLALAMKEAGGLLVGLGTEARHFQHVLTALERAFGFAILDDVVGQRRREA